MNRRQLLASMAALSAGCVGSGGSAPTETGSETAPRTEQPPETSTRMTEAPSKATETAELPESTRIGMLDTTAWSAAGARYIRYYDNSTDELARLQPERTWWVMVLMKFENLGGEDVPTPTPDQFDLVTDAGSYGALTTVPRISWGQVRARSDWFQEPGLTRFTDTVNPGLSEFLYLLYDVATFDNPVVRVDADSTHRLTPRIVTTVDG